jgi:hypothetical protein
VILPFGCPLNCCAETEANSSPPRPAQILCRERFGGFSLRIHLEFDLRVPLRTQRRAARDAIDPSRSTPPGLFLDRGEGTLETVRIFPNLGSSFLSPPGRPLPIPDFLSLTPTRLWFGSAPNPSSWPMAAERNSSGRRDNAW